MESKGNSKSESPEAYVGRLEDAVKRGKDLLGDKFEGREFDDFVLAFGADGLEARLGQLAGTLRAVHGNRELTDSAIYSWRRKNISEAVPLADAKKKEASVGQL